MSTDAADSTNSGTESGKVATAGSGTPDPTDAPRTGDPDTSITTSEFATTGSGTPDPTDAPRTDDPDTSITTSDAATTGSGAPDSTDAPRTGDPDTSITTSDAATTGSGAPDSTDAPRTGDPDTSITTSDSATAGSGASIMKSDATTTVAGATDIPRTTDPHTALQKLDSGTTDTGATASTDVPRTANPDSESGAAQELTLAAAPEGEIRRVPVDAPPTADPTGELDILAVVERAVDRLDTAIREGLGADTNSDTKLRVQVTYDAARVDAGQASVEPEEAAPTTASDRLDTAIRDGLGADADSDTKLRVQVTHDAARVDAGQASVEPEEAAPTTASDRLDTAIRDGLGADADSDTKLRVQVTHDAARVDAGQASVEPEEAAPTTASDRLDTAIREGLGADADSDTKLRVQVTYDAARVDVGQAGVEPEEAAPTTASGLNLPADDNPAADSGAGTSTDIAGLSGSAGVAPPNVAPPNPAETGGTGAEAKEYVKTLIGTAPATIPVDEADHFVTQDHVLSLVPADLIESVSVAELLQDETLATQSSVTIVREVEQVRTAVPERIIAESRGDLESELRVLVKYDDHEGATEQDATEPGDAEGSETDPIRLTQGASEPEETAPSVARQDTVETITVREALERIRAEPQKPLTLVKKVRYFEVLTLRELLDSEADSRALLNVVTKPYRIEAATLADLLQKKRSENPDTIFYLHTVQPTDDQGIWGIVQFGIIDNFARGVAVKRGEKIETYTVRIPRDADERLGDRSSSFLGKLIDAKTKDSYVYNYRDNRMGRNPHRIYPGQEIVIINFEPQELESIYEHFAGG